MGDRCKRHNLLGLAQAEPLLHERSRPNELGKNNEGQRQGRSARQVFEWQAIALAAVCVVQSATARGHPDSISEAALASGCPSLIRWITSVAGSRDTYRPAIALPPGSLDLTVKHQ